MKPKWNSPEAERAVLGAILLVPATFYDIDLASDDFFDPKCREVWRAICEASMEGDPIDPIVVDQRTGGKVGVEFILELMNLSGPSYNAPAHAAIVRAKAVEREVRRRAHAIFASELEGEELAEYAQRELIGMKTGPRDVPAYPARQLTNDMLRTIDLIASGQHAPDGMRLGLEEVDRYLGIPKGSILTIAGRPSMGKSAVVQWMEDRLVAAGERVLHFSTESHRTEVITRAVSREARVNSRAINDGKLNPVEYERVRTAAEIVARRSFWVDDSHVDIAEIVRQVRRYKASEGITTVVLDHLQEATHRRFRSRDAVETINALLDDLRGVCREEPKVHAILVSQLNRGVESREGRRPLISDLKSSGKIEEASDVIMLLFRPYYYDRKQPDDLLEVAVAKNRNGPTGVLTFGWDIGLGHCIGPVAKAWEDNRARGAGGKGKPYDSDWNDRRADLQ